MNEARSRPIAVPVVFGDCFGWYHPASRCRPLARGVVLCPPFGVEALWTYRNLRILAELLAEAGLPVLRFDYPGTGDSPGGETAGLLERWLAAVGAAVSFVRRYAGTEEVALCGLRLGGLLAAEALRHLPAPTCRLALLAPVVSGAFYAHELAIWGRLRAQRPRHPDWVEVAGFSLHASDVRRLESLDLKAALAAAAPSALLVLDVAADRLRDDAWCARLTAAGTILSIEPWVGYADFMREAHLAAAPLAAFARVAAFLGDGAAPAMHGTPVEKPSEACVRLDGSTTIELPVTFGRARDLFGILCAPDPGWYGVAGGGPAVVILNTASNHRIGDARYAVLLARDLAAQGVASLRVDLGGIGDSPRADDERLLGGGPDALHRASRRLYGRSHTVDVRAALDALEARGYGPFLLVGVCSGAHAALDAALDDPRVTGLALGNLPSFKRIVPAGGADGVPARYRLARVLFGQQTRYWLTRTFRQAGSTLERRLGRVVAPIAGRIGVGRAGGAAHALHTLAERKAGILLVYSRDDPAFSDLEVCFGAEGRGLGRIIGVRCVVIDGNDHSFSTSEMRERLIACVEQHVRTVLLAVAEAGSGGGRQEFGGDQATNATGRSSFDASRVSGLRPT